MVRCINRTQNCFQKASFQFVTEDISFFTIAHFGLPNISLQVSQELSSERLLEGKAVTL